MTGFYRMRTLPRRIRTAIRFWRQYGTSALMSLVRERLRRDGGLLSKTNLISFYGFVRDIPIGKPLSPGCISHNTVNWVIPMFGFGSGGHLNIFRFIHHLEAYGFECRVVIVGDHQPSSIEQARKQISDWFFPVNAEVFLGMVAAPPAHITIATSWITAYFVRNFMSTIHKCYFVQDFEPYFYSLGSEYAWAEDTYRLGFTGITAGTWLKEKLSDDYGMRTDSFSFSFDKGLYKPHARRDQHIRRVFFYARPPTARRAFEMGMLVLDEVCRRLPDVKVVFAGWDVSGYEIPFEHLNAGTVALDDLPDLYSQCDVALVLSFTNLSLLPLELMACGTPVVSNRASCTEWLLNDTNARLADATVESLADALCFVLENAGERERLRINGLQTAALTDWEVEAHKVGTMLRELDGKVLRD